MTTIINFYGGPGIGKSTVAAYVYYLLKSNHLSVELVREYVKVWAWDNRKIRAYDQPHIVAKQMRDESLLYDKTNWLVSDSPVPMNLYYARAMSPIIGAGVKASIQSFLEQCRYDGHNHINILLKRTHPYQHVGRYQTHEQAIQVDNALRGILDELGLKYVELEPTETALQSYVERLLHAERLLLDPSRDEFGKMGQTSEETTFFDDETPGSPFDVPA